MARIGVVKFDRDVIFNPQRCDKRSFRTITAARGRLRVICCLNDEDGTSNWDPNRAVFAGGRVVKGVCNTKTVTQSILKPKRRGRAGGTSMAKKRRIGKINVDVPIMRAAVSSSDIVGRKWCKRFFEGSSLESCLDGVSAGLVAVRDRVFKEVSPFDEDRSPSSLAGKKRGAKKRKRRKK